MYAVLPLAISLSSLYFNDLTLHTMIYHPNCILPAESVQFIAAPGIRSTLEILWASVASIIACTYSTLHLNVPEQRRGRDQGWTGDLKWAMKRIRTNAK